MFNAKLYKYNLSAEAKQLLYAIARRMDENKFYELDTSKFASTEYKNAVFIVKAMMELETKNILQKIGEYEYQINPEILSKRALRDFKTYKRGLKVIK